MSKDDKVFITQVVLPVIGEIGKSLDRLGFNTENIMVPGTSEKIAMELVELVRTQSEIASAQHSVAEGLTDIANALSDIANALVVVAGAIRG